MIKVSDLSLTVLIVTLTPLFLLVTSPLIIHELPSVAYAVGIFMILVGAYVLNLRERNRGHFAPLRAILREKGSRLMLVIAFI